MKLQNSREFECYQNTKVIIKLSTKASAFSESERAIPPRVTGERSRNSHHPFGHPPSDWSLGSMDSSVTLHWLFLPSLSRRVSDLCRRLTSALRAGSLVTCHCLRSRFFRRISSLMPARIGGHRSPRRPHLGVDATRAFRMAPEKFSTHV